MKIILTIFAALLCASTLAYDLTPAAARVDVPVDQLNGVKDQLMKTLLDKIEALDIPNVNVSKKILFFDVDLSIEDIKVDFITANFFLSEFDFKKPNTIAFTSYMQQLNVSFNLSVKFFKTFNLGSVVARMSKTPLSLDIELDTTSDKKFSAQIKNLDVKFGPLDLTLGDKQSEGIDILEMLIQMVGNHILKKDGAEVLGGLEGKVNEMLKTKLGDMSTEYPVPGTDLVIDFSPAGTPNVRSG